ncbi:memo-like protein [Hirsutella rhossiliensis]|uniref:Memo-like protein n=1 Tax=Hirsutella rhossiliensis TaxID=111463 RepID=A0A9P8MMH6_9HYPO|nr:memo-like protein [Hirsutella rhossiliensis]KAH0957865.1 memo-like protein [Hirsutella rhossiliensis]
MATRPAGKAGSWYLKDPQRLHARLDEYLAAVPKPQDSSSLPLPVPGARLVIAPHAGYDYSGKCAAWAYSCLDLRNVRRVFVLGPSHTYYLEGCAVTAFAKYATPFGDLTVDRETVQQVKQAGAMADMPQRNDEREHSLEMHLPYLYKCCERTFASPHDFPAIVPMLVGDNDLDEEKSVGRVLVPYLKDPHNAFIISSDFCHWGSPYQYTAYSADETLSALVNLDKHDDAPRGAPIHDSIRWLDEAAMDAVASGRHDAFVANIQKTRNTVCGRHPIGVAMAGLELLAKEAGNGGDETKYRFKIVQYDRSNLVKQPDDYSVSYVSAYAVL